MKRFVAFGNECVEYLKAAKASEGKFLFLYLLVLYAFFFLLCLTFPFLFGELQML
jgi:hypothetical protein